jgi:hypothetical protein
MTGWQKPPNALFTYCKSQVLICKQKLTGNTHDGPFSKRLDDFVQSNIRNIHAISDKFRTPYLYGNKPKEQQMKETS